MGAVEQSAVAPSNCPLCGRLDDSDVGVSPPHLTTRPACWAHYRRMVGQQYRDPARWELRGLTRDAYGAQHAGGRSRAAVSATGIHLIGLSLSLDRGLDTDDVGTVRAAAIDRLSEGLTWLQPPTAVIHPSIEALAEVDALDAYSTVARRWAEAVWSAWERHHPTVRRWIDWLYAASPPHLVGREPTPDAESVHGPS